MRLSSTGAKALGLGRSGSAPLKLGLGGGGKESTLEKEMVKQLEETLKAKDAELDALKNEVPAAATIGSLKRQQVPSVMTMRAPNSVATAKDIADEKV